MSDFNALLGQFHVLQVQVEKQRPKLCSNQRRKLYEAARNLLYASRGDGEESYPPPMHADAMMKNGVAPAGAWGSHPEHAKAVGGKVPDSKDTVPALLSPGDSFIKQWGASEVPSGWIDGQPFVINNPSDIQLVKLPDQSVGWCKPTPPTFHPGFNVLGTMSGRTAMGERQYMEKPIQGLSCEITKTPEYENLRRLNEEPQPIIVNDESTVINNLFPFQEAFIAKVLAAGNPPMVIKTAQSLGKSEEMLPGSFWLDRQREDRVHRAQGKNSPLIVEIAESDEKAILMNLADKKKILEGNLVLMRDALEEKERQASMWGTAPSDFVTGKGKAQSPLGVHIDVDVNTGKLTPEETARTVAQRIKNELRRGPKRDDRADAIAYAEMTNEFLGEPFDEPVIINQEKKDESR